MRRGPVCLLLLAAACGHEVPASPAVVAGPRIVRRVDPQDLFPADLDLVVRVDLARMRSELGPGATAELAARALAETDPGGETDPAAALQSAAVARADVVWVALRAADVHSGDRVVVAEGKLGDLGPSLAAFRRVASAIDGVQLYDALGPVRRGGTGRVVVLGERAVAFVSPVEVDAAARVLRDGADEKRGDPVAEGIVSADLRARPLPPLLARRFPSIGGIVAGIERVRGVVLPDAGGLRFEGDLVARTPDAAERALRFLQALRDNSDDPRHAQVLSAIELARVDRTVRVRWPLPSAALLDLLGGGPPTPLAP